MIFPELDGRSSFLEARATLDLIAGLDVRVVILAMDGRSRMPPGPAAPILVSTTASDPVRNAQNAVKVLLKFCCWSASVPWSRSRPCCVACPSSKRPTGFLRGRPRWSQLVATAASVEGEYFT